MFGEEGYNPFQAEHAQCNKCGKMIRGPHAGTIFRDKNIYAADKTMVYNRDEAEDKGLRHNVSGSYCPDCFQAEKEKWRQSRSNPPASEGEAG